MINESYFYLNVLLLSLGTILVRGSFIAFSGRVRISPKIKDLFSYIPAAVLPTLIVPATFFHQGMVEWMYGKERFIVLIIATVASFFIRGTLFCIVLGLALLYLFSLLN